MRTQYSYNPPPGGTSEWILKLKPLIEPPLCYATFLAGLILAVWLFIANGSHYSIHILILLIALPVHELAHAIVADRLGDSTPRYHGHLTLNPFAQLNVLGSILVLAFGLGFAYVPINPQALRPNPRIGHMIVAVAGPLATLALGLFVAILWHVLSPVLLTSFSIDTMKSVFRLLFIFSWLNIALFFFNLLPLAPLDGFFVLRGLLPATMARTLESIQQYSMYILIAVVLLPYITDIDLIEILFFNPACQVTDLLFWSNVCR